jgi:hypothetical protein
MHNFKATGMLSCGHSSFGKWLTASRRCAHSQDRLTCTEGSNPFRSARQSELQRIPALSLVENHKIRPFFAIVARQVGLERPDHSGRGSVYSAQFLYCGMSSPTLTDISGESSAITKRIPCEAELDFSVSRLQRPRRRHFPAIQKYCF